MKRRLPPLSSLRAFEAAARHLSFAEAAAELAVTPAAVSHQVKRLEDYLGVKLFRRLNRQVLLTDAGQLDRAAMDRAVAGLQRMKELATRRGVRQLVAVATSAVREATNGPAFVARVRAEAGITTIGATVPRAMVEGAPMAGPMVFPPVPDAVLMLPADVQAATGFNHLQVGWELHGHPPATD